jgi:hypothetical protein
MHLTPQISLVVPQDNHKSEDTKSKRHLTCWYSLLMIKRPIKGNAMPPCVVPVDMNGTHHVVEINGHPNQKLCRIRRCQELFLDSFVSSWMCAQTGRRGSPFSSKPVICSLEHQPRPPHNHGNQRAKINRHVCLLLRPHVRHSYTCSKRCQVKVWQHVRRGGHGGFLRIHRNWSHR